MPFIGFHYNANVSEKFRVRSDITRINAEIIRPCAETIEWSIRPKTMWLFFSPTIRSNELAHVAFTKKKKNTHRFNNVQSYVKQE